MKVCYIELKILFKYYMKKKIKYNFIKVIDELEGQKKEMNDSGCVSD